MSLKKLWISVPKKLPGGIRIQKSAGAPKALRYSQLCCVDNHEQPRRGESLFASTKLPVYRLEPSPEERGPGERWSPFFNGKEGDGG